MIFETIIGLEVHLQLNTNTKIFCGCANLFGKESNTLVCPVCLGLPGTLPVLNQKALSSAIKIALALNCQVNPYIKFDRKNYYYPDLPKGYQISQYDLPVASHGWVEIPDKQAGAPSDHRVKRINIKRAHLEEDAGKSIHDQTLNASLVDYNRTGTPLMEIVSDPDLRCAQEAYDYLTTLKLILQYLNVSDCDMEKGSLRCDANISIRPLGEQKFGVKAEVKNMNSFKAVKMALEFEENRQRQLLLSNQRVVQETRLWNEEKGMTFPMRSKEEAHDYRYFPEPDLVPFMVRESMIEEIRASLPELPHAKLERFLKEYQISEYDAQILIQDPTLSGFFEECVKRTSMIKKVCNWLIGPVLQELNLRKVNIQQIGLQTQELVNLIDKVEQGVLSNLVAKDVFKLMLDTGKTVDTIVAEQGLTQVSDDSVLEKIVEEIINDNEKVIAEIKQGKTSAMGFLVGQAMKKTQGKANPKKIGDLIKRRFENG